MELSTILNLTHGHSFLIDDEKCILAKVDVENKVEDYTFDEHEVYHLDVAMSTGDGKTREVDEKQRTVWTCHV
jgi:hypothetical protein